jgi:hypothetical protein
MNVHDQAMLDLVRIWIPYGGARPADILVAFGMSPERFYANITRILGTNACPDMSMAERRQIEEIAARFSTHPLPAQRGHRDLAAHSCRTGHGASRRYLPPPPQTGIRKSAVPSCDDRRTTDNT